MMLSVIEIRIIYRIHRIRSGIVIVFPTMNAEAFLEAILMLLFGLPKLRTTSIEVFYVKIAVQLISSGAIMCAELRSWLFDDYGLRSFDFWIIIFRSVIVLIVERWRFFVAIAAAVQDVTGMPIVRRLVRIEWIVKDVPELQLIVPLVELLLALFTLQRGRLIAMKVFDSSRLR